MEELKIFCSEDPFREVFHNPFQYGKYICATDSYCLAVVEGELKDTEKNSDVSEGVKATIDEFMSAQYTYCGTLSKSTFEEIYSNLPLIDVYEDCENCDGYGTIECMCCSSKTACEECDGTGNSDVHIGKKIKPYVSLEYSKGRYINPNYLKKVFTLSENIEIFRSDRDKWNRAKMVSGNIIVFIMEIKGGHDDNIKIEY